MKLFDFGLFVIASSLLGISSASIAEDTPQLVAGQLFETSKTSVAFRDRTIQANLHPVESEKLVIPNLDLIKDSLFYGDLLEVTLDQENYYLSFDSKQDGSKGVVTFIASVLNAKREVIPSSRALITLGGGELYGLINLPGKTFQIIPTAGSKSSTYFLQHMASVEVKGITDFSNIEKFAKITHDDSSTHRANPDVPSLVVSRMSGPVDLLVFFTPYTRSRNGGVSGTVNWINTIVASYNQKIAEVGTSGLSRLNLTAALETSWPNFPTPYHEDTTNPMLEPTVVGQVPSSDYPFYTDSLIRDQEWVSTSATVANFRETYDADLVALITAANRTSPGDNLHGYAGLKEPDSSSGTHGGTCVFTQNETNSCGEFVSIRDSYALANLTFDHEVGHALGLQHSDGVSTFGYNGFGEIAGYPGHQEPQTIMEAWSPICSWSSKNSSSSCRMRLPFYASSTLVRQFFHSYFITPRIFAPGKDTATRLDAGMNWLRARN